MGRSLTVCTLGKAVAELRGRDPELASVVDRFGPPPLWARRPGFATLVRIILEQQVSLTSAKAAYQRLQGSAGRVTAARVRLLGEQRLRSAGITRQKASYCHALATEVDRGRLDLAALNRQADDTVRTTLRALPGVGPWTIDIYLLMALGRPDVWPTGDLALAKAVRDLKRMPRMPSRDELADVADSWAPYRAVAARILWHYYLSQP